jgi:hypothetical protein
MNAGERDALRQRLIAAGASNQLAEAITAGMAELEKRTVDVLMRRMQIMQSEIEAVKMAVRRR